jgi:hypothetical protein
MNKGMVWGLFILLTLMQAMGNTYYTYIHLKDFSGWIELFGLVDEELIYQKRILSMVSGAILPIVALGFIKSLVDYIRPSEIESAKKAEEERLKRIANEMQALKDSISNAEQQAAKIAAAKANLEAHVRDLEEKIAQSEQNAGDLGIKKKKLEAYEKKQLCYFHILVEYNLGP